MDTAVQIEPGDEVRTLAEGTVDFSGRLLGAGLPPLTADGEDATTPTDYPFPGLRKNSLVCLIADSAGNVTAFQGGIDQTFRPGSGGQLSLTVNDVTPADNTGSWNVVVERTTPDAPTATRSFGPFMVGRSVVDTGTDVTPDDEVRITGTGTVNFGGFLGIGAPVLTADGEDVPTPADYPAPDLRKNSLICQVSGATYQGGVDRTFRPAANGRLLLLPNDATPADNLGAWSVTVTLTRLGFPLQAVTRHGPFTVVSGQVSTGVRVDPGDEVRTISRGVVDFGAVLGIGAPILSADGEDAPTPADYPAPHLRKNSLVVEIDERRHQGGIDRTVRAQVAGEIVLFPNDRTPEDNSRGWVVVLEVLRTALLPGPMAPSPLRIIGMEVVQAIQRADTSVRLVSGKRTVVRVFVEAGAAPQPGVRGTLAVVDASGTAIGAGSPLTPSIVAQPDGRASRSNFTHSVNFELPLVGLDGIVRLDAHLEVVGGGRAADATRTVAFQSRPPQPIQPILLTDGGLAPTMDDFITTLNAGRKRWPAAEAGFVLNPTALTGTVTENLTQDGGWDALLGRVAGMMLLGPTALRVALVPDRTDYANNGIGRSGGIPGPPAFVGKRLFGATFAHELAHVYGVGHAPCPPPGANGAPANVDSRLPAGTETEGVDVEAAAIVEAGRSELMTYCGDQARWVSIALWDMLFDRGPVT